MSTELFVPPAYAKVPESSEFYIERIDNPKRAARRERSRLTAEKRWAKPGAHDIVDIKQAKAVDVFDLEGVLVGTYASSRKAAIALGLKNESNIRCCRRGSKKSYCGYMFRNHAEGADYIAPWERKKKKRGYSMIRKPGTSATRQIVSNSEFGVVKEWDSMGECAADLGVSNSAIWIAIKQGRKIKGHRLEYKYDKRKRITDNNH